MEWWNDTEGFARLVAALSGATVHVERAAVFEQWDDGIEIGGYRDYTYQNPQAPSDP